MRIQTKFCVLLGSLLTACHFSPLYNEEAVKGVCVAPVPEASGAQITRHLKQYFPETSNCLYTLTVNTPKTAISDQSISDKDFITMQQIDTSITYSLLDKDKKVVLKNNLSTKGSSAVVSNPYSTVMAIEKTESNLNATLAEQIALHIAAFLNKEEQ